VEARGYKREICRNSKWNGEDIPLDNDHQDGNSDNNSLENIRLICPNCHRQTKNHGSKNKGNGKQSRRAKYRKNRYDSGLSW
jgi:hypothetical protein